MGTFDLVVFKVILGHLVHFVSKWPATPNDGVGRRAKLTKLFAQG